MFFGGKNAPFVPGDREGAAGGQSYHAEPIRCTQGKLREASRLPARQTLSAAKVTSEGGSRGDNTVMLPVHLAHSKQLGHAPIPGG
jgi:hypothetical protein